MTTSIERVVLLAVVAGALPRGAAGAPVVGHTAQDGPLMHSNQDHNELPGAGPLLHSAQDHNELPGQDPLALAASILLERAEAGAVWSPPLWDSLIQGGGAQYILHTNQPDDLPRLQPLAVPGPISHAELHAAGLEPDIWVSMIQGGATQSIPPYGNQPLEPAGFRLDDGAVHVSAPPGLPPGGVVPAPSALTVIAIALALGGRRRRRG